MVGRKRMENQREREDVEAGSPIISAGEILGTQQKLDDPVYKSLIGETIRLLLIFLAPAAQESYLRGWKFWSRYCEAKGSSPWVDRGKPGWDLQILNYLTCEHAVMKIGASGLATRSSAIKSIHVVEGRGGFANKTQRIHSLSNAIKKKGETKQHLPANPALMRWGKARMSTYEGSKWKAVELWDAMLVGLHFALRISEVENLEDRDISFEEVDGKMCVAIIIRGSKTYQQNHGVRRTLRKTSCDICPVLTMATWLDAKSRNPNDGEWVFSRNIGRRLNHTLGELAREYGLDETRFPHPLIARRMCHNALRSRD